MNHYRIYLLNDAGRVVGGTGAACHDDQDACVQAQQALDSSDGTQAEVWSGIRCIGRVAARPTPVTPKRQVATSAWS